MTPEQDPLIPRIPQLLTRLPLIERQKQRVLFRDWKATGHLEKVAPFWKNYAEALVRLDVGPYNWGIERCPLVLTRGIRRQTLERRLLKLGGSLEIVPVAKVYRQGVTILVHLHTNTPDLALAVLGKLGEFQCEPLVEDFQKL